MQAFETKLFKALGYISRRVIVNRLLLVVALGEAYALAVDDVDGGDEFYHNVKKFLIIRSPTAPLFSGWNWQV